METLQVVPLRVRVDLGAMTINEFSTFSWFLKLISNNQMQFSAKLRTSPFFREKCYPFAGDNSQRILHPTDWA